MTDLIATPGDYLTRSGSRVTIREIKGPSTFSCKGSMWIMYRGRLRPRHVATWMPDGRYSVLGQHKHDIVGRYETTDTTDTTDGTTS